MTFPALIAGLFFLFLPLVAGCSLPRVTTVASVLHGSVEWSGTVLIDGDVVIDGDATLRVAPGTQILFLPPSPGRDANVDHPHFPGSELIVKGRLHAVGTPEQPIIFAYRNPSAPPGTWGGVNLVESPAVVFRYCLFRQADSAVHSQQSQVVIEDCRFSDNLVAIRFHDSPMRIERNSLTDNGTAIRFHGGAPLIRHNDIHNNDKGIFITSHPHHYSITGNNIVASRSFSVVLGEEVPEAVALPGNWWGSVLPTTLEAGFYDGRRSDYLGQIDYRPWSESPFLQAGASWNR